MADSFHQTWQQQGRIQMLERQVEALEARNKELEPMAALGQELSHACHFFRTALDKFEKYATVQVEHGEH